MPPESGTSRRFRVLFLGGAKRVSLAEHLITAGRARGLDVEVFSYELDRYVPIAKVARVIEGRRWADPLLDSDLDAVIQREAIDGVIPFVDPAIEVCSRLATRQPAVFVPVSNLDVARRFFDKTRADEWFRQHEFPVPCDDGRYPQIAKPRHGSASQGLRIFRHEAERRAFFAQQPEGDYLVQRFIDGIEYTVDCYVSMQGEVLSAVPRTRLEVSSGESTRSRTCRHAAIEETSRRILSQPGFRGPVTIQFIEDRGDRSLFVMEINPRFGGAAICSIRCGADTPGLLLDEFLGRIPREIVDWEDGFIMTRAYQEVYFHAAHH